MYGAMREHAPNSTRMAGLGTALLMTAAVGYALANGFIGNVAKMIDTTLTFTPIVEERTVVEEKKQTFETDTSPLETRIPILIPTETFTEEKNDERITVPPAETRGRVEAGPVGGGTGRTASPVRTRPALLTRTQPPYPPSDIRKQNTGTTSLQVCLDASGRVTSADVARSSGHATLDNAALKWVRNARFTPAKSDGAAEAMCGHKVDYEWKLEDAR